MEVGNRSEPELHASNPIGILPAPNITNISTRASVQTGPGVTIAGFIVTGTDSKQVVIRGLGPTLTQFGVSGVLADPILSLFDGRGTMSSEQQLERLAASANSGDRSGAAE